MHPLATAAVIVGALVYVLAMAGPLGRASRIIADRRASTSELRRAYVALWAICFLPMGLAVAIATVWSPS
jgi:hypothetical protein